MKTSHIHLLFLAALCIVPLSPAQSIGAAATSQAPARATLAGIVIKDPSPEPVKKALIELIAENQNTGGDYTAITSADGTFRIEGIVPGRYRLMVERTGFVEAEKHQPRSEGRLITLAAGQELKDVMIRLQATAAIDGRVTDEDGDPLADAQVAVLRQTFTVGRSHWEQIGAQRTNDLGEYRIATLPAGRYYISITPPPDFKSLIEAASNAPSSDTGEQPTKQDCSRHLNENCTSGKQVITSYMTTYYPGVKDRAQAAPVQLRAGEDFPANFSLTPSPTVAVRGSIGRIPAGASAAVMLRTADSNSMLSGGEVRKDGTFEIRDVSPGTYTLLSTVTGASPDVSMARQTVEVGGEDISGLHLVPQPGGEIHGRLRLESKNTVTKIDPGQFFIVLRSADGEDDIAQAFSTGDVTSNLAQVAIDGSFNWKNVPPGRYFVALAADGGASPDWFVKSVMTGGRDVSDSGFNVSGGTVALDVVASGNGTSLDGIVTTHNREPLSNATVVLIPEVRYRSRSDFYRKTVTDQSGRFVLQGIRPGSYTLFALESLDGEEYSNPEFLKNYEGQGRALRLEESEHISLQIEAVPSSEEQP
jgi:protocatechuate 3,4-dioxygenase beta subunit